MDTKNEQYRTTKINSVFGYIADLSELSHTIKKGTSQNSDEKSHLVPLTIPNLNELLKDTRDLARIWDLYSHLVKDQQ